MAEDRTRRVTSSLIKPLIAIMVLACLFVGGFLVVTQYYSDTLFESVEKEYRQGLINTVSVARNIIEPTLAKVRSGEIGREEALRRIRPVVRAMTYEDRNGKNYVFMSSYDGIMLVQPYEPEREMTNQWDLRDVRGTYIIRELVRAAREHPEGSFVRYYYYTLPTVHDVQEKLAYVVGLPEVGSYIGTGIYMSTVLNDQRRIVTKIRHVSIWLLILFLVPVCVAALVILNRNRRLLDEKESRARAEKGLAESEAKYRSIFENSVMGIFQSSPEGRVLGGNPAFSRILGYATPEEMVEALTDVTRQLYVTPGDRARFRGALEQQGYVEGFETEFYRKDGTKVWASVNARAVKDSDGNIAYYEGTVENITERKRSEEALRTSRLQLSQAMDLASIVYWEVDLPEEIFVFNDPFYAFCGTTVEREGGYRMTREEFAARFLPPEERPLFHRMVEKNRAPENAARLPADFEHRIIRRDGEVRNALARTRIVRGDTGEVLKIYGAVQDVTDRKLAERALVESEEKYRNVVENSLIGFYIVQNGLFRYVNRQFCEIVGYSYDEIVDRLGPLDITHPGDRDMVAENIRKRTAGEAERIEYDFRTVRKDGKVVNLRVIGATTLFQGERVPSGSIIDVTREKTLEDQLLHSQKMEAVGTLAGGIAHDFNNILTALVGYADLLRISMSDETLLAYVDQILSASQKATDLVRGLLAFSRQQAIILNPVGVNSIVRRTEKLLRRLVTEDIEVKISLAPEEIVITADTTQIDQILFNLATNARDAMPGGGTLSIETRAVELTEEFRHLHGYGQPGRYALLSVSDTGVGMDRKTGERAFEPFFTTKEVGKGTGLGLSTVYGIVKQHDGYISLYSEPGKGTTFQIYLPVAKGAGREEEALPPVVEGGHETILVAEDNEMVRELICQVLARYGYTTVKAVDGADAVSRFRKAGNVDLLILDSVMPGMNGRRVYDEIQKLRPDIKVIFTSGYTRDVFLDKGIGDGDFNFLQKPILPDVLLKKVREVLGDNGNTG
ncbi:MAG: Blue-light-activated protein [Syntrophorhabdus sp. PtaB.Bin184]|nr:MAG: Blue-light-activated protein [Syntrophorhabdus sp. PtaB.Bin184]